MTASDNRPVSDYRPPPYNHPPSDNRHHPSGWSSFNHQPSSIKISSILGNAEVLKVKEPTKETFKENQETTKNL
ncbi:hypothetical protein MA16_Dca014159 [Dendrobium catenatum]|uniref:Uncharacterized protein n=1 Tax=Dendrobium catenatum TaxID=906689 RepID=A0A2I0VTK1_9ASPA|nr:hypothetical protein MA16_Dca014159 [Dendrobium catenatum]